MEILSKGDFYTHYNNGMFSVESTHAVTAWRKPTGALCHVVQDGDCTQLFNGDVRLINDALSAELVKQGVTGDVIIHHPTISRAVSRWLTYNLGKEEPTEWLDVIRVYTFGDPGTPGRVRVTKLEPFTLQHSELKSTIDLCSKSLEFDGLYIDAELTVMGMRRYHLLPNRYVTATILSVLTTTTNSIKAFICEVEHEGRKHHIKITAAPSWLKRDYYRYRHQLPGKHATIQYTVFTPGDRINNFSSPAIISIAN